jgi:hypothetical protein
MCECGCISCGEFYQLPGPKGSLYVLQIYPGCDYCSSPIAIIIRHIKREDDEFQDYKECQLFKLKDYGHEISGEIEFLSEEFLIDSLRKFLLMTAKEMKKDESWDEVCCDIVAEEFARDFMRDLNERIRKTQKDC